MPSIQAALAAWGEQGWGRGTQGLQPYYPPPCASQVGAAAPLHVAGSCCVSALLHSSGDEAELGAWPGYPLHQVVPAAAMASACPGPSTNRRGSREDLVFGGARLAPGPVACSDIKQVRRMQLHGWMPLSPSAPASSWDPAAHGATISSRSAEHCSALLSWQQPGIWESCPLHGTGSVFVPSFALPHHWPRLIRVTANPPWTHRRF